MEADKNWFASHLNCARKDFYWYFNYEILTKEKKPLVGVCSQFALWVEITAGAHAVWQQTIHRTLKMLKKWKKSRPSSLVLTCGLRGSKWRRNVRMVTSGGCAAHVCVCGSGCYEWIMKSVLSGVKGQLYVSTFKKHGSFTPSCLAVIGRIAWSSHHWMIIESWWFSVISCLLSSKCPPAHNDSQSWPAGMSLGSLLKVHHPSGRGSSTSFILLSPHLLFIFYLPPPLPPWRAAEGERGDGCANGTSGTRLAAESVRVPSGGICVHDAEQCWIP